MIHRQQLQLKFVCSTAAAQNCGNDPQAATAAEVSFTDTDTLKWTTVKSERRKNNS
jgi:hypothetical protein